MTVVSFYCGREVQIFCDEIDEEINKLEIKKMAKVDGDMVGTYDGIVRIIYGDICKTIYLSASGCEDDRFISLNDCLKEIEYNGEGICIVIIDNMLRGKCYQFGNYDDNCWYEYGETMGYA